VNLKELRKERLATAVIMKELSDEVYPLKQRLYRQGCYASRLDRAIDALEDLCKHEMEEIGSDGDRRCSKCAYED